ncbi:P-loop containing nucleoside triphosphate hydrolase protein [Mycena leptocephala]|nr:P-loop containing nucleoside triphosphate hydrolase protein [Mycena leptocephala]
MLPSKPKIFYGRESELEDIVKMLNKDLPRIAILGAGGMGKTSLARAAVHHPNVTTKYEHRFFITCDSTHNSIGIAAVIGAHLGLNSGRDLTKPVLRYLSKKSPSLLILDNLETPWEPKEARGDVEEFLSLLTDIQHLALIITMRGAERPAKVRWTRPFLQPLKPLTDHAAWQTFVDIAEDYHEINDIKQILKLTDNMPLAVDLIAHLVDSEGCSNALSRWETEKTSVLSAGKDRRSSLDASIALSISSYRMKSVPGSKDLLSLLSILPDGLSNVELLQSNLPIQDILGCKAILLGTSLAYLDDKKKLKSLVPIREHVLQFYPPSFHLMEPLQKHFQLLLDLYQYHRGEMQIASKIDQLTSNLGNLKQVLQRGLHINNPDLSSAIEVQYHCAHSAELQAMVCWT